MKRMLVVACVVSLALNVGGPAHAQRSLEPAVMVPCSRAGNSDLGGRGRLWHVDVSSGPAEWRINLAPRAGAGLPAPGSVRADSIVDDLRVFWDEVKQTVREFWRSLTVELDRLVQGLVRNVLEPLRRILQRNMRRL